MNDIAWIAFAAFVSGVFIGMWAMFVLVSADPDRTDAKPNCETQYAAWCLNNNPTGPEKIIWLFNKWKVCSAQPDAVKEKP